MKIKEFGTFVALLVLCGLAFASTASAQERGASPAVADRFVISAKAGGVSDVEGSVSVLRHSGAETSLSPRASLEAGELIATGEDGFAEVMLNPGSFVRVGPSSKFSFLSTDLDRLTVELRSGSAIFEVYADDTFSVVVKTPWSEFLINRPGVFRVDVLADSTSRISVWKGNLVVGSQKVVLKGGRAMVAKGNTGGLTKFDRDEKDQLDVWSALRGKQAARANAKLQRKALAGSLVSSFNRGSWDIYRSFGVWVYDAMSNSHFFLPFGNGWRSPYGHWFGYDIWNFNLPVYIFYPNPAGGVGFPNPGGGGSTGQPSGGTVAGGSGSGGSGSGGGEGLPRPGNGGSRTETRETSAIRGEQLPPFMRFEATQRSLGNSGVISRGDWGFGGGAGAEGTWSPRAVGAPSSGGIGMPSQGPGAVDQRPMGPISSPSSPGPSSTSSPEKVEIRN